MMACCGQLHVCCGPDFTVGLCVSAVDSFSLMSTLGNYLKGSECDAVITLTTFWILTG